MTGDQITPRTKGTSSSPSLLLERPIHRKWSVWVDLEWNNMEDMRPLEVALKIFDNQLICHAAYSSVIFVDDPQKLKLSPWSQKHLPRNRLLRDCADASQAKTLETVDAEIYHLLTPFTENDQFVLLLAGSSSHYDLRCLQRYLPRSAVRFSHRVMDVSALLEMVRRFMPHWNSLHPPPPRSRLHQQRHRAEHDLQESLDLMRHYRQTLFLSLEQNALSDLDS